MPMVVFLMLIWGADLFFLPRRIDFSRHLLFLNIHRVLFSICVMVFLISFVKVPSSDLFALLLFASISSYVFFRRKIECAVYHDAYYETEKGLKRFLLFSFFGILMKWFWGVLVFSIVLKMFAVLIPQMNSELGQTSFLSLAGGLWMVFLVRSFCRRTGLFSLAQIFGLPVKSPSFLLNYIVPLCLGSVIALASSYVFIYRVHQPITPFSELLDWANVSWTLGIFLFAAVISAPFLEEIIFRGFFFRMIQEYKNARWAFVIVALSFGILHVQQYWGDWLGIAIIFLIGIILTMLRYISGSTRPGMLMHYTFNILMVIIPSLLFVSAHPFFARFYLEQDKLSIHEKQILLRKSIDKDQRNAMAYYEFSVLYMENQQGLDQALGLIEQALAIDPQRTIFQYTKAKILYAMGRFQEAKQILEGVAKKVSDHKVLDLIHEINDKI